MLKTLLKVLLGHAFFLISFTSIAQVPAKFNFQGVARKSEGDVLVAENIALRFSIRTGTATGTIAYRERRSALTDSNGVFNVVIGGAGATEITGDLNAVLWTTGDKFLQVEMDILNGSDFVDLGAAQLLSVPYALFSNNSGYASSSGSYFFEALFPLGKVVDQEDGATQTLVFPRTNYNQLNNATGTPVYDTTTGEFIAPQAGIYQLDFIVEADVISVDSRYEDAGIYLYINDKRTRKAFIPREGGAHGAFLHARVHLKTGDKVSIIIEHNVGIETNDIFFSGYKIN